jgi:hypothetical protein
MELRHLRFFIAGAIQELAAAYLVRRRALRRR